MFRFTAFSVLVVASALFVALSGVVYSCPFCSAVQQTLSEEIKGADAALIVRLNKGNDAPKSAGPAPDGAVAPRDPVKTKFAIVQVLKGEKLLGATKEIEVLYFGTHPSGTQFFVTGVDPKNLAWSTPTMLSPRAVEYLEKIVKLPETGANRLVFFQDYFEDADALLAGDAYDEFAKSPYADVQALKSRMPREKLIRWIQDKEVSTSRRRLYLTMLGVCGTNDDVTLLENLIRNEDRQVRTSLDALVACYLNLRGADGLPLIVELFLKNKKAEYTDTYATIMALRFHGTETTIVPRAKLLDALRHMLDRPQLADLVIPDLARWEDWGSLDKLVTLFKEAKEDSIWVRVPVINFLRACPLPEAKQAIDDLAKIDPESVKRASQFFPLGGVKPPPSAVRPDDKKKKPAKPDAGDGARLIENQRPVVTVPEIDDQVVAIAVESTEALAQLTSARGDIAPAVDSEPRLALASEIHSPGESPVVPQPSSRFYVLLWAGLSTVGLTWFIHAVLCGGEQSRN